MGLEKVLHEGGIQVRVKDTLPVEKQSKFIYKIPCSCGWRPTSPATPLCRHLGAPSSGQLQNMHERNITLSDGRRLQIVNHARIPKKMFLKKVLRIQLNSAGECFDWDEGLELPNCWIATLR